MADYFGRGVFNKVIANERAFWFHCNFNYKIGV